MEVAGLAFATATIAKECLQLIKTLRGKYEKFHSMEAELPEYILELRIHWRTSDPKIREIQKRCPRFDHELQVESTAMLILFRSRMSAVTSLIDSAIGQASLKSSPISLFTKKGKLHRLRYAFSTSAALEEASQALSKAHRMLDQLCATMNLHQDSGFAIIDDPTTQLFRGTGPTVGTSIFLPESVLDAGQSKIKFTSGAVRDKQKGGALDNGLAPVVLVDTVACGVAGATQGALDNVRILTKKLSAADPSIHSLLTCRGVIRQRDMSGSITHLQYVFDFPPKHRHPESLRSLLLDYPDLETDKRLKIANELCNSILFLHVASYVHKNVRPENIIAFRKPETDEKSAYLIGFTSSRPANVLFSAKIGDMVWNKNLYRHPQRQGERVMEKYVMQHDIYSLGVCLLEVGLWKSFVMWDNVGQEPSPGPGLHLIANSPTTAQGGRAWLADAIRSGDSKESQESSTETVDNSLHDISSFERATSTKEAFVAMARSRLPVCMSRGYADVVVSCLTCLDPNNNDFGDESEFVDEDGLQIGMRYMQKVGPCQEMSSIRRETNIRRFRQSFKRYITDESPVYFNEQAIGSI